MIISDENLHQQFVNDLDKDFGELIFAHQIKRITIVFLRYKKEDLPITRQTLRQVIAEYYPKHGKYFITINAKKVRITTL